MNTIYSTTNSEKSKRGKHLAPEERGAIQQLHKLGYSNRFIARELNRSPSTIGYELKRGTAEYSGRGRKPRYSAKRGGKVYESNRLRCRRPQTVDRASKFIRWTVNQIRNHKWSFDACVGRARLKNLFPKEEIPCTKTLYNLLWNGELPLTLFELPEVLSRRKHGKPRVSKRSYGKSIEERPAEIAQRNTFGHWEVDTVLGRKKKGEKATFTIIERLSSIYLTIQIDEKTTQGVAAAVAQLKDEYGNKFKEVFKSITTDNGSEFADFASFEALGTQIYFAHPYSSWERPVNERKNRVLRKFLPKGRSMNKFTPEQILMFADEINSTPTKSLNYHTPEELFEVELDNIYHAE